MSELQLNTIRQSLSSMVTKSGIDVKTEEEDSEDFYHNYCKNSEKEINDIINSCLLKAGVFFYYNYHHLHHFFDKLVD